jgi:hypothetical protein
MDSWHHEKTLFPYKEMLHSAYMYNKSKYRFGSRVMELLRFKGVISLFRHDKGARWILKAHLDSSHIVYYRSPMHFKGLLYIVMDILRFKGVTSLFGHDIKGLDEF